MVIFRLKLLETLKEVSKASFRKAAGVNRPVIASNQFLRCIRRDAWGESLLVSPVLSIAFYALKWSLIEFIMVDYNVIAYHRLSNRHCLSSLIRASRVEHLDSRKPIDLLQRNACHLYPHLDILRWIFTHFPSFSLTFSLTSFCSLNFHWTKLMRIEKLNVSNSKTNNQIESKIWKISSYLMWISLTFDDLLQLV